MIVMQWHCGVESQGAGLGGVEVVVRLSDLLVMHASVLTHFSILVSS